MEQIIFAMINNPKSSLEIVGLLILFIWCFYKFGILEERIKNIIAKQELDNNNIIKTLNEVKTDLKEDIKNLSQNLFEYVRSQKK